MVYCILHIDTINSRGVEPALRYIQELGGWSLFGGQTGIEGLSLEEMLAVQARRQLDIILYSSVEENLKQPTEHEFMASTIQMSEYCICISEI